MHQETILLLDGDAAARGEHLQRIQEAGYLVQESLSDPAGGTDIEHPPELVVASMPLNDEHREQIKHLTELERRPFFLFLLSENRSQDGKEAIDLGADDMLKRPFASNDLQARLRLLAERRRRENLGRPGESGTGNLEEVSVRDLISLFAAGKGTATVQVNADTHRGKLFFQEGQLCAVSMDHRHGLNALTRLMRLTEGEFTLTPSIDEGDLPGPIEHPEPLQAAQEAIDKWEGLLRKLPNTNHSIQVDFQQVQQHLDELNDLAEQLLWQLASHRSLEGVIDDLDGDLVEALTELYHLYEKGFFSTRSEEQSNMFSETHTASIEGLEASIALRSHRGGGFNERLADAAKEAALQLMAAAQPVSNPHLEVHPDQFPSFAEMAAEGFSQDALSSLPRRSKETNSHSRLEPALFPLEEINDEKASSFALDDFKNLSTEPPGFDTTVPSVEAANPDDFEDIELPIQIDFEEDSPKSLPTGDFNFAIQDDDEEQAPLFAADEAKEAKEAAPLSEEDEEEGVRQMLKLETMDVLDRLLQNELSSIEMTGIDTPQQVKEEAEEEPIPTLPVDQPVSLNSTMPFGIDVNSKTPVMAAPLIDDPEPKSEPEPEPEPEPAPKPKAPSRIQLQPTDSTSLSIDDLPASQKGAFPSLSLSDEFFIPEEDLKPVKPNRTGRLLMYLGLGALFTAIGFFGMGMIAKQGQPPAPTKRPIVAKKKPTPRPIVRPIKRVRIPPPLRLAAAPDAGPGPDAGPAIGAAGPDAGPATPPKALALAPRPAPRPAVTPRPQPRPVLRPRPRPVRRPKRIARARVRPRPRPVIRRPKPRPVRRARGNERRIKGLYRRALTLKRRERFSQAESLLRRALRMKPGQPAPLYSALGQVLYEREKTSAALSYLKKAYSISPRQTGNGLVTLGSIYYEKRNRKRAKQIYRQYLKYFPRGKHADDVRAMIKN